jgi:hypothetical protein
MPIILFATSQCHIFDKPILKNFLYNYLRLFVLSIMMNICVQIVWGEMWPFTIILLILMRWCGPSLLKLSFHKFPSIPQWLAAGWWFSLGTPVSSTKKPDRHDITEILLKVTLNTTKLKTSIYLFPAIFISGKFCKTNGLQHDKRYTWYFGTLIVPS